MLNLSVCIGSACHLKGSYNVISAFQHEIEKRNLSEKIEIQAIFCLGECVNAVSVKINDGEVCSVSGATASDFFENKVMAML